MLCVFAYFSIKGFSKGFFSTLFSLIEIGFVLYVSYMLTDRVVEIIKGVDVLNSGLLNVIKSTLDKLLPGEFSSVDELFVVLDGLKVNALLSFVLRMLTKNLYIDGVFSFGGVFAPIFHHYVLKAVAFALIFIVLNFVTKILKWACNLFLIKGGLSGVDRVLGVTVGLLKGYVFFGVIYYLLFFISSFTASEMLQSFFVSGNMANTIYSFALKFLI